MLPTLLAAAAAVATSKPTSIPSLSPEMAKQLMNFQFSHNKSWLAANHPWVTHTFAFFALATAVALVVLLAFQTTKQEGLSGTIGGRVESAYRPRLGFDQQLQRITTFVALAFVVFATVVSISGI